MVWAENINGEELEKGVLWKLTSNRWRPATTKDVEMEKSATSIRIIHVSILFT